MLKNRGVIIVKPKKTDYIAGLETGIQYEEVMPSGDWTDFLPSPEYQSGFYFDTMACVTFSALNCIETQVDFLVKNNKLSQDQIQKLRNWGYLDENGVCNFSDRFTAKMSGTTHQGNTLTNVWDSIRKDGLVPESMWAYPRLQQTPVFNWDDYYVEIPQNIKDFAKNIFEIFDFKYEWVVIENCGSPDLNLIKTALKQAPLQIASPTCSGWSNNPIITPCGTCQTNHATMIYGITANCINDFDHYDPFSKYLSLNYTMPYILKGVTLIRTAPAPNPVSFGHVFNIDMKYQDRTEEVKWLQKGLKILKFFPDNVLETGYYGEITSLAVRKFQFFYQVANVLELLCVNGKRVGLKTRTKLNQLLK